MYTQRLLYCSLPFSYHSAIQDIKSLESKGQGTPLLLVIVLPTSLLSVDKRTYQQVVLNTNTYMDIVEGDIINGHELVKEKNCLTKPTQAIHCNVHNWK